MRDASTALHPINQSINNGYCSLGTISGLDRMLGQIHSIAFSSLDIKGLFWEPLYCLMG